jgi:hypothetical protein
VNESHETYKRAGTMTDKLSLAGRENCVMSKHSSKAAFSIRTSCCLDATRTAMALSEIKSYK